VIKDEEQTMELKDILTTAIASIIVLVIAHLVVFWVVRTLYPPPPPPAPFQQTFTQPTVTYQEPQQHVTIPTHEADIPTQAPRQEEQERRGPPPPEATSIHGGSRVDSANPQ
jgi:hypothetical protein